MAETIIRRENSPSYTAARVIYTILWLFEVILGLRFILRLIAANPAAGFTDFIYRISRPLVDPFINVVRNSTTGTTGGVIEWSTIIAMIVYALVAWAIVRLFSLAEPRDKRMIIDDDRVEPV